MLKDLLKINRVASLEELKYVLFEGLKCDVPLHYFELYQACKSRSFDLDVAFRDMIDLLEHLGFVKVNDEQQITLNCEDYDPTALRSDTNLSESILEKMIDSLEKRKILSKIFNHDTVRFDIDFDTFTINFSKIPLEFPMIKKLLMSLGIVEIIENVHSKVIVRTDHKKMFSDKVLKQSLNSEGEQELIVDADISVALGDKSETNKHHVKPGSSTRVLLVVATEIEAKEILTQVRVRGLVATHTEIDKLVRWDLGTINNSELIMIKIGSMGSGGASGATLSIKDGIDKISPDRVIMVGIAFGLDKGKQQIGDILVSRQVEDYDLKKQKDGISIQRGDKIPAGITLRSRFENSELTYTNYKVRFGLMLSGDTLSDDDAFVQKLKVNYPEAIGAEMEGSGLQGTCHRENIEWILIKGICDWGFNKQTANKEKDQQTAISNVCDFLFHTLQDFEL